MPTLPHSCHVAGCPQRIPRGEQCPHHGVHRVTPWQGEWSRRLYDGARGTAHQRGYGARWRRTRAYKVGITPYCERCAMQGRVVVAEQVHHRDGDPHNNAIKNLESLCATCHSRETLSGQVHA